MSYSVEIVIKTESIEGGEKRFGVWYIEGVNDKRKLWDVLNVVTSGHDKRGNGRSSKS